MKLKAIIMLDNNLKFFYFAVIPKPKELKKRERVYPKRQTLQIKQQRLNLKKMRALGNHLKVTLTKLIRSNKKEIEDMPLPRIKLEAAKKVYMSSNTFLELSMTNYIDMTLLSGLPIIRYKLLSRMISILRKRWIQ